MLSENTLYNLTNLLTALSFGILIGCLHQIIFENQKNEKSINVITLALVVSLSIIILTWESLEARILIGYILCGGTIWILIKEMRTK